MMVTSKEENNMNEDNNNNFILVDEDKPKEKKWKNHKDFTRCCHRMFLCNEWLCIL